MKKLMHSKINVSAPKTSISVTKRKRWLDENKAAIVACNEFADEHGIFADKHRVF